MGRTALELVGQGGLGHSFDPLTEDITDEYTEAVKEISSVFSTALAHSLNDTRSLAARQILMYAIFGNSFPT